MIQVVDGKKYNTKTATEVFERSNCDDVTNFRYRQKTLYRTKNGAWFIYHQGGPMTDMAVSTPDNTIEGSSNIEPVSDDDAFGFLQAHSEYRAALAAIEHYFADRVVDA